MSLRNLINIYKLLMKSGCFVKKNKRKRDRKLSFFIMYKIFDNENKLCLRQKNDVFRQILFA